MIFFRKKRKHFNNTEFAWKISTSSRSYAQTPRRENFFPKPQKIPLEHPGSTRRKETSKHRVDRAEPIRQTANPLPLRYISSPTSTKIQFVENSRLLEEQGERYIYIEREREREYRFRGTSIMEDSVQGSAIILHSPPRGSLPWTIIPGYIVRI